MNYVIMRYVHQKDPLLYRYELQKIDTGETVMSTITVRETAPIDIMREYNRCNKGEDK